MVDYAPFSILSNLEYLENISGGKETTGLGTIGTLTIPDGKMNANDRIIAFCNVTSVGTDGTFRLVMTANSIENDLNMTAVSARFSGVYVLSVHPEFNDSSTAFIVGAANTTAAKHYVKEADHNDSDWLSNGFTIDVKVNPSSFTPDSYVNVTFFILRGSNR